MTPSALAELLHAVAVDVLTERGLDVAVFKAADQHLFALLDRCPHKGGPLSQGIVFGHSVACPLHNWSIALDSGEAAAPDQGQTPRFALKVEHGQVFLDAHELDTLATEATRPLAGPARRTCPGVASGSCSAPAVGAK